jgi:hypothetical protein
MLSFERGGDVSGGRGCCASLPYCLGWGEYGQLWLGWGGVLVFLQLLHDTLTLGCRDSLFVLKTLLTMRKNHNLPSHVAFVDLVKAYDTANHALMLDILEWCGAPPRFISAIERTYQDLVVVLKIEKEVVKLPQTVGVRQGDNMAPVLFLFLMSVFAETLEAEWQQEGIESAQCDPLSDCPSRQAKGN